MPELHLRTRAGSPQELDREPSLCFDTTVSIPSGGSAPAAMANRLPVGTTLQRYVLLERVGAGAMGIVYAAYDYGLDRKVALKLLREPRNGTSQRRRLMREAQALARLSHPNVVAVHDIGSHGDQVFIAMEYVDGRTLRRWYQEERRSLREILAVFRAAGEGLAAAHEAGIVHRDFKPDNVLVDRHGRARVSDFGLAKVAEEPAQATKATGHRRSASELSDSEHALTRTGTLFGTPAYMALEQHLCKREIDARADQFSFAVALYEAACGVHPFDAETPVQIADNILHGRIHEPRRRVPGWLVRALLPALAADPERRYPSMAALLRTLRERRPWRIGGIATCAVAAGVSLFVAGGMFAASRDRAAPAVEPGEDAELTCQDVRRELDGVWDPARRGAIAKAFHTTGAAFADELWARLGGALARYADDWTKMRFKACEATGMRLGRPALSSDPRIECLDRRREDLRAFTEELGKINAETIQPDIDLGKLHPIESCADSFGLQHEVQPPDATVKAAADALRDRERHLRALLAIGQASDTLPVGRKLVADAAQLGHPPVQAQVQLTLAGLLWAHGEISAAEATLVEAVETAEAGRSHRLAVQALLELLWLVGEEQGRHADAHRYAQFARGKLAGIGGDDRLEAQLEDSEGVLWLRQKQLAAARRHLERGRELYEKVHGPDSHQVSASFEHLGALAQAERRFEDAVVLFRRARQLAESVHGLEHSVTLTYLAEEAKALYQAGRHDEAFATNQRGHELLEEEDVIGVMFLANLGLIEWKRKQYSQARAHLTQALGIVEKLHGREHVSVAELAADLGLVLEDMGRLPEATALLTRAAAIYKRAFGAEHPDLAAVQAHLGRIHTAARRP